MIDFFNIQIRRKGWQDCVKTQVVDSSDLSRFKDDIFTHSITNFGIFGLSDPVQAAREIRRTLKDGGQALVTVWSHPESLYLIHRTQKAIRPDLPVFEPMSMDWMKEWKLEGVMEEAGFSKVEMHEIKNWWQMETEEQLVDRLSSPFWDAAKKDWTEEDKAKWRPELKRQLTEEQKRTERIQADAWAAIAVK